MLSAANIAADVRRQQLAEQQRIAAYERGRAEALAAQAAVSNDPGSVYKGFTSLSCAARTRAERHAGMDCVSTPQWRADYMGALAQRAEIQDFSARGDSLNMFFSNYPSIYGQLYTYPK